MKSGRAARLAAVLIMATAACRSTDPLDVRISLPGTTPFGPGALSSIVVAGLHDEALRPDFSPGLALEEALVRMFRRELKNTAGLVERAPVEAIPGRDDAAAWRAAGAGQAPGTVFLAGAVKLSSLTLKALDAKGFVDGPFDPAHRLLAKLRWTLAADVFVISAATGEILYHGTFRESQDYAELDKPADFAFSALSERVLDRLGQALLGRPTIEVRTLLRR